MSQSLDDAKASPTFCAFARVALGFAAIDINICSGRSNDVFLDTFRRELDETIAGKGVSRSVYEALTDDEFEDDQAYVDFLKGLRAYLFEDGPLP
ncbi:hypothetical protein DL240_11625 [Lujinxingia litoralis]|uniref:CdiI immunity protein domain-containing protein n=1 Tax=Lujinxingia litoralis TaxID=2211119 RepID=A0A328C4J1_9DELT|nr:hypothetical protein [Lujinxingia litoralis]RAL21505.1 hypothetical protein DL240_11625 [Lujinxingia litoralis]